MEYPLITVIIPQKDRAEYIEHTLRTCMLQDYPNFQIVVSDDCSEDDSVEVISNLAKIDSRIKLFAHKQHLGMRENFEFALRQATSGYVIALGGDDGLVPGAVWKMYKYLQKTKRELLTWIPASFSYPKYPDTRTYFGVRRQKKENIKIIKSESFLNKLAKNFNYMTDDCPMFYMKGIASVDLINKVKARTDDGSFYYCPTPDGFSGVVLAGEVDDYVMVNEPLSIVGTSVKSQGLNYARTDQKSRKEAEQFFLDNSRKTMHKDLASQPYSPLTTLMTADYLLTARDLPGWPGRYKQFKFEDLIKAAFRQIEYVQYDNAVIGRELKILKEIAKYHGLLDLYNKLLSSTKRRVYKSKMVYGFAITNSLRFEGTELGINNIFDAAIAVNFVHNYYKIFTIQKIIEILKNNLLILKRSKCFKYIDLPVIE